MASASVYRALGSVANRSLLRGSCAPVSPCPVGSVAKRRAGGGVPRGKQAIGEDGEVRQALRRLLHRPRRSQQGNACRARSMDSLPRSGPVQSE